MRSVMCRGGLYCEDGLDIPLILQYLNGQPNRVLAGFDAAGVEHITNEELLTVNTDILVPAAIENQITRDIAQRIKAKVIVEGANGPTAADADEILDEKGIIVVPDILANAGGVVVSYFEWVQNIQSLTWDEEEINKALEKIMKKAFSEVWECAKKYDSSLRLGANITALDRIVKAKKMRGVFP